MSFGTFGKWVCLTAFAGLAFGCGAGNSSSSTSSGNSSSSSTSSSSSGNTQPASADSVRLSEAVAKSQLDHYLDGNDWIELKNVSSQAVNLNEFSLQDSGSDVIRLPSRIIQPGEYYLIQASDEEPENGGDFLPFKLGKEDSISLIFDGNVVDSLSWKDGDNKQGRSYGYLDGVAGTIYPTPGYDNAPYQLFDLESVRKVTIEIPESDWDAIMANPVAEQYYSATFDLNGARLDNVGFRTKGQGSLNTVAQTSSHRHGFKVNFEEYVDQKFMGMKKLVFNNSFSDPSMMRDFLSYKLMKEAGVPSPETSYVDLWVNDEHLGLYLMVEAIDTEFIEKYFPDDKENDFKGDLYKGELFTTLQWVDDQPSSYSSLEQKTNKSVIGTEEEGKALIPFLDSINHDETNQYINTDIMVRYLAASALNGNMDSHIGPTANNFYLYHHVTVDKFTLLPWDYNLAFGMWGDYNSGMQKLSFGGGGGGFTFSGFDFDNFDFGDFDFEDFGGGGNAPVSEDPVVEIPEPVEPEGCMVIDHVIDHPVNDNVDPRPMIVSLLKDPEVFAQYRAQLQSLVDGAFKPSYLEAEIQKVADLIDPYVKADPTKFFTYEEWKQSLTADLPDDSDISGGRGAGLYGPAPGLVPYITKRANIVQQQLDGSLPSDNSGDGSACPDA